MPVRISIVIPVWNDAALLERCLAALARQTRAADEIIVVDNNSTDGSGEVASRLGARLVVESLQGIAPASAAGYDASTGDLIGRLDADSRPPADWLERIEQLSMAAGALTVVTGPGHFYDSGRLVAWLGRVVYLGWLFRSLGLLLGHPPIFGSNFMMSRELWMRVRGSVHSSLAGIHDDIDLSYQLHPDMTVRFVPSLAVGISGRPLSTVGAFTRRARWLESTLRADFRDRSPIRRLRERRRWANGQAAEPNRMDRGKPRL